MWPMRDSDLSEMLGDEMSIREIKGRRNSQEDKGWLGMAEVYCPLLVVHRLIR